MAFDGETEASGLVLDIDLGMPTPQFELVTTDKRFPAMVAGYGAGKTQALLTRMFIYKMRYPTCNAAYYLPTFDLARTIFFPRAEEMLNQWGLTLGQDYKVIYGQTPKIVIRDYGEIIVRTMDNPERIVGYEVADSYVDELDTLKATDAKDAWRKILARNRQKKPDGKSNTIAVGTTPEGFRFTYEQWEKAPPTEEYQIIRASTWSNKHNLPDDYIDDLMASYPANLLQAYIEGEFVNLKSGSVYPEFDRVLNACNTTPEDGEAIHWGMDFNVTNMTAIGFVNRERWPHACEEITKVYDTPAMIEAIKRRFPNRAHFVYPDASGQARKSVNASTSDIELLRQAGFHVYVNDSNPAVKDRILAVNGLIHSVGNGRRLKVNIDRCPAFTDALEKQAYDEKKGEPDKKSGFDHASDAGGYFLAYRFPIKKHQFGRAKVGGV